MGVGIVTLRDSERAVAAAPSRARPCVFGLVCRVAAMPSASRPHACNAYLHTVGDSDWPFGGPIGCLRCSSVTAGRANALCGRPAKLAFAFGARGFWPDTAGGGAGPCAGLSLGV